MRLIAFKICLLFSFFIFSSPENEEFFVFDVGQGNCQLILYHEARMGFLFDAGSSSKLKHPKLIGLTKADWLPFLKREEEKKTTSYATSSMFSAFTDEDMDEDEDVMSTGSDNSSGKVSLKESHPIEAIGQSIQEAITESQVEWLIVFLSHPDKDHINLINQSSIPEDINLIAYLGADFLGTESETEVARILSFFKSRDPEKTWVEFPFYWGWNDPLATIKTYPGLRKYFSTNDSEDEGWKENKEQIKLNSLSSEYNPDIFFQGSCFELLQKTQEIDDEFHPILTKLLALPSRSQVLQDYAYIWSMNQRFYDINNQSTVVSFVFTENQITLICTGDAGDISFKKISDELERKGLQALACQEELERVLVIPHHGSKNNISQTMLKLFQPTMFIVSAGNGKQYGHPDLETYEKLKTIPSQHNWEDVGPTQSIIAFDERKKAHLKKSLKEEMPFIFSTNFTGTVRFTNGEFSSLFTNIIEINKKSFVIDISKRVEVESPIPLEIEGIKYEDYYEKDGCYYYGAESNDGTTLYYEIKEPEEE